MSTSGGFDPPQVPECVYAPQMTRAQALARRTAGTLDPNCVVVITDGPTIGTAGNTSPTQIELNPVSATDLGMVARVHTTFHPGGAWAGLYDIDSGPNGSIQRLVDHWNNLAQDIDTNSPTIHTQVPWHKGSATFRDNVFEACVLTGWSAAGGTIRDNHVQESTVNLTGKTGGTFTQNQIVGCTFTSAVPTSFINGNQMTQAVVSHLGTTAGSFSLQNNVMLTGVITIDAATTSQVTMNNNVFGGVAGGFRVLIEGKTVGTCIISGNRLFNNGPLTYDLRAAGSNTVNFTSNEVNESTINMSTATDIEIRGNTFTNAQVGFTAGTTVKILRTVTISTTLSVSGTSILDGGRLMATTLTTGGFNLSTFDVLGGSHTLTTNNSYTASGPGFTNLI